MAQERVFDAESQDLSLDQSAFNIVVVQDQVFPQAFDGVEGTGLGVFQLRQNNFAKRPFAQHAEITEVFHSILSELGPDFNWRFRGGAGLFFLTHNRLSFKQVFVRLLCKLVDLSKQLEKAHQNNHHCS